MMKTSVTLFQCAIVLLSTNSLSAHLTATYRLVKMPYNVFFTRYRWDETKRSYSEIDCMIYCVNLRKVYDCLGYAYFFGSRECQFMVNRIGNRVKETSKYANLIPVRLLETKEHLYCPSRTKWNYEIEGHMIRSAYFLTNSNVTYYEYEVECQKSGGKPTVLTTTAELDHVRGIQREVQKTLYIGVKVWQGSWNWSPPAGDPLGTWIWNRTVSPLPGLGLVGLLNGGLGAIPVNGSQRHPGLCECHLLL